MLLWPLSQMHWHLLVLSQGGYKLQLLLLLHHTYASEPAPGVVLDVSCAENPGQLGHFYNAYPCIYCRFHGAMAKERFWQVSSLIRAAFFIVFSARSSIRPESQDQAFARFSCINVFWAITSGRNFLAQLCAKRKSLGFFSKQIAETITSIFFLL